jgi:hypothetical protein
VIEILLRIALIFVLSSAKSSTVWVVHMVLERLTAFPSVEAVAGKQRTFLRLSTHLTIDLIHSNTASVMRF